MKQKGFTLIELIVVIVLLSLIALVVFPAIFSSLKSSKEIAYKSQKEIVLKAAKEYCLDNTSKLPEMANGQVTYFDIDVLIEDGYISEDKILNPKTNKKLSGQIKVSYEKQQYIYEFIESKSTD